MIDPRHPAGPTVLPEIDDELAKQFGAWPAPFGITLVVDRLSALMLCLTAALGLGSLLYAVGGDDRRPNGQRVWHDRGVRASRVADRCSRRGRAVSTDACPSQLMRLRRAAPASWPFACFSSRLRYCLARLALPSSKLARARW